MIPILLDKQKNLGDLVDSKTGGLGDISGAYEGKAIEEANGLKEISFKLPIDSPKYNDLKVGSYIKAKADDLHDLQIYEVYKITRPMNGIVTVKAQHISYILGKASVLPFTATGIIPVINAMQSNIVGQYPFTMETDIVNPTNTFTLATPMSFRAAIGGWQGSILDTFGGELDWDNLTVKLLAHRGVDNGVRIEYGKNLTSLTQEESIAKVYDAVIGYAVVDEVTYVGEIQKIVSTNSPRTLNVDFSSEFDTDHLPTTQRLNELAMSYAINNDIGKPSVNLKISFELLSKTTEYKDIAILERTGLFDTVYVSFPKLGVESKAKVIKTEYDFINEKPISVELGDAKTNLTNLIDEQINQNNLVLSNDISSAKKAISIIDQAIEEMSSVITNSLGLFYTRVVKADGSYQYYLHNKPTLQDSQYQWTINAGGFALSQDYGATWSAGIDSEGNAVFNSLSANIVKAMQIYGSYLVFGDYPDGKYIEANTYSNSSSVPQGVSFDGTGTIRMQPQEAFFVNNLTADGNNNYNKIALNKNGAYSNNLISFTNYDDTQNYIVANFLEMDAHFVSGGNTYNRFIMNNYSTITGTRNNGNLLLMEARENTNFLYLRNYKNASTNYANMVSMSRTTSSNICNISNYNFSKNTNANYITLSSYESGTSASNMASLQNFFPNPTTSVIGNALSFNANLSGATYSIYNNKLNQTTKGNEMIGQVLNTTNIISVNNYQLSRDAVGNQMRMTSSATEHRTTIQNYDFSSTKTRNIIEMYCSTTTNGDTLQIANGAYPGSTSEIYSRANEIRMSASSSDSSMRLTNRKYGTSSETNYILLDGNNSMLTIWSKSDLRLRSNGAVRLESGGSQDITLTASDDIYMNWGNKLRMQGYQIGFGSVNGVNVLTWA